jgi:hypothetical protein
MKKIKSITVQKVKGIDTKTFDLELIPNKPSILVAPNGFGKSSLTAAFNKLNTNGIKLDKDTFYQNDEANKPKLSITIENDNGTITTLTAEENLNTVKNEFDVFVINNLLIPKHKKQTFGGKTVVSSSIEVAPITLIDKIPVKETIDYTPTVSRAAFGTNGKILPNISALLSNPQFIGELVDTIDFPKFDGAKISAAITKFVADINLLTGNANQILVAGIAHLADLKQKGNLEGIVALLDKHNSGLVDETEKYCTAILFVELYRKDKKKFTDTGKYCDYINEKTAHENLFKSFNATWKNIKPKEVEGALIIEFPKANQISNGERDVITFLSLLIRCRRKLKKENSILIIDEVFDYLDDANLITAQYYITKMIASFKAEGRKIFPLIMTHLNPYYFKNFCFKDQKVYYLNKAVAHINRAIEKIIFNRENLLIKPDLDKYFLHYHTNSIDAGVNFNTVGLDLALSKSVDFKTALTAEVIKYLNGRTTYDPISVCLAVRLKVEEVTYSLLTLPADQNEFLTTHMTINKLNFAEDKGVAVSDTFYLLGVLYNDIAHIRPNTDYATPIISKLNNRVIKNVITKLFA